MNDNSILKSVVLFVLNVILNKTAAYQKLMRNNIALMHVVHCQSLHLTHDDSSWWTMRIKLKSCFDLHWHYPVCALQWRHAPHCIFISGEPPIFHFLFNITFTVSFGKSVSLWIAWVHVTIISNMLYNLLSQAASMRIIQLFWWNAFANWAIIASREPINFFLHRF